MSLSRKSRAPIALMSFLVVLLSSGGLFAIIVKWQENLVPTKSECQAFQAIKSQEWASIITHERGFPYGTEFIVSIHVRCPDTDGLIKQIAPELTKLRQVSLYAAGTNLTDNGLSYLHSVPQLNEILAKDTQVTDSGINQLISKTPNCKIVRQPRNLYPPNDEPCQSVLHSKP